MVSIVTDGLRTLLSAQRGVASSADLRRLGLTRDDVRRLVGTGELVRVRRGSFVDGQLWGRAPRWELHALRARAVHRALADRVHLALSHHSALSLGKVAIHGVDDRVHLVRTDGGRSRPGDVVAVHAGVPEAFVQVAGEGLRSVVPAMACLQVAARFGIEAGLVSTESALRQNLCSREDLDRALDALGYVIGCPAARRVVEMARPLSESAGESRSRWLFVQLGLPEPAQQVWVRDQGAAVGRVDFLFERERVIVEFDGMLKYGDISAVHQEKLREDALRALGYEVVRLTWADLATPEAVGFKIHAAFARAARRGA